MLKPKKLGFAGGILGGLIMLIATFLAITNNYGTEWLHMYANTHPGYTISKIGCIVGMVYGFIDGFVLLYLFGWIYNKIKV
jgi:hypothetical protein